MKIFPFKAQSMIGLDIQPDAARLVQLKKPWRGSWTLERMALRPLPDAIFSAGNILQWEELGALLAEWFEQLAVCQQRVAIAVPMNAARVRRISLPTVLTDAEIETEILTYLQQDVPGLNEPLNIDFSVLSQHDGRNNILFTAVRAAYLTNLVECVALAGLNVKIVDVDLYALRREVKATLPTDAVLHIKNKMTALIVFNQHEVIFHQQWATNDLHWQENLTSNLNHLNKLPEKKALQRILVCGAEQYTDVALPPLLTLGLAITTVERPYGKQPDYLIAHSLAKRAVSIW